MTATLYLTASSKISMAKNIVNRLVALTLALVSLTLSTSAVLELTCVTSARGPDLVLDSASPGRGPQSRLSQPPELLLC